MHWLLQFIVCVDAHQWLRKPINLGGVLVTGLLALAPLYGKRDGRPKKWWQRSWVFFACLALSLFFCRVTAFFIPGYINIDEAMLVAQALTYEHYPMPWRDVDPTTNGPLNGYALLWGVPFGLQPSYPVARITALFCIYGMMMFLCLAGRRIAGEVFARISILPIFLFQCFAYWGDFYNYTNELVSLFLIGWAIYLLERLRRRIESIAAITAFGLIVGLLPWAKLQSVMPAAALILIATAFIILRRRISLAAVSGRLAVLTLASAVPSALLLLVIGYSGAFIDFWQSYIEMARNYGIHYPTMFNDIFQKTTILGNIFAPESDMAFLTYLSSGFAVMAGSCLLGSALRGSPVSRDWYWAAVFLTVTMIATILVTNLPYLHYHLFLLPAFGLLTLAGMRLLRSAHRTNGTSQLQSVSRQTSFGGIAAIVVLISFLVLLRIVANNREFPVSPFAFSIGPLAVLIGLFALVATMRPKFSRKLVYPRSVLLCWIPFFAVPFLLMAWMPSKFRGHLVEFLAFPSRQMVRTISELRPPGARLAIWGWDPEFAAEAGMPLGTRDSHTQWAIEPNPLLNYFRQRYLHDMQVNRPELFLEATGPGAFRYKSRQDGIACFPELEQLISEQYHVVAEVDGMRLFMRNDLSSPRFRTQQ